MEPSQRVYVSLLLDVAVTGLSPDKLHQYGKCVPSDLTRSPALSCSVGPCDVGVLGPIRDHARKPRSK